MKPFWEDSLRTLYNKDCRSMVELPDSSVQCVVTSPPYWGLRKYAGVQDLIWGGDNHHEHVWQGVIKQTISATHDKQTSSFCQACGARRWQLGLEPTPELYIQHLIEILREIKRVLRPDGVVFWNIGDSYAGSGGTGNQFGQIDRGLDIVRPVKPINSLKPKDLCLIPERFALAAQQDGWYIRSRICWNKPNSMPESVRDRPTDSWEHIWMLTKSARYYYDAEAVREPIAESTIGRVPVDFGGAKGREYIPKKDDPNFRNGSEQWGRTFDYRVSCASGRNLRSVWTFPTAPYKGAHFATFPEALPDRCIKAATSEKGCCAECGKPWERVIEKGLTAHDGKTESKSDPRDKLNGATGRLALLRQAARERGSEYVNKTKTLGWKPTCECNAGEPIPCLVLDPFAGSGTTLKVAAELGRWSVGYEISEEYCRLAVERNKQGCLG